MMWSVPSVCDMYSHVCVTQVCLDEECVYICACVVVSIREGICFYDCVQLNRMCEYIWLCVFVCPPCSIHLYPCTTTTLFFPLITHLAPVDMATPAHWNVGHLLVGMVTSAPLGRASAQCEERKGEGEMCMGCPWQLGSERALT